jgi:long-chain acyl-CoA synthetase
VRRRGRAATTDLDGDIAALRAQIDPHDLATLLYTSGTTGQPKGVMLSHENVSFDALTAFSGIPAFILGDPQQTVLSFLPLTHIFARALHYGYMAYGMSVYFTTPKDVARALKAVRPTAFATVPRVLEKVYTSIRQKIMGMEGLQKRIGTWSLGVARRFELGERPPLTYRLEQALADALVFSKWREALGGRVELVVVGGAALSPELANVFGAAGITAVQGYGLTETSPVIAYNRPDRNHAGTVGEPMAGVEVRIADDGEILTRGPHVMMGYYKDPAKTAEVLSPDGWFHTGDIGTFTDTGLLRITDRKKSLFKLSTGKYVIPQPIENALADDALIDRAVVMGTGHKFCTALIFPAEDALRAWAREQGLNAELTLDHLVQLDAVVAHYQAAIDAANEGMDHWSTVKRFAVVPSELTVESGLLTPTMKVKRRAIHETFTGTLDALYDDEDVADAKAAVVAR